MSKEHLRKEKDRNEHTSNADDAAEYHTTPTKKSAPTADSEEQNGCETTDGNGKHGTNIRRKRQQLKNLYF